MFAPAAYAIQEELGAGGMATVYLAEDVKHHRKVAVKDGRGFHISDRDSRFEIAPPPRRRLSVGCTKNEAEGQKCLGLVVVLLPGRRAPGSLLIFAG
jgi:serine/threonine protein kinase